MLILFGLNVILLLISMVRFTSLKHRKLKKIPKK
nr:MAG TPA: hypothetical protein [Caudoviricetes sp.]